MDQVEDAALFSDLAVAGEVPVVEAADKAIGFDNSFGASLRYGYARTVPMPPFLSF